jgi:hypothetical protein
MLPKDVWIYMVSNWLDWKDLGRMSEVSREYYELVRDMKKRYLVVWYGPDMVLGMNEFAWDRIVGNRFVEVKKTVALPYFHITRRQWGTNRRSLPYRQVLKMCWERHGGVMGWKKYHRKLIWAAYRRRMKRYFMSSFRYMIGYQPRNDVFDHVWNDMITMLQGHE